LYFKAIVAFKIFFNEVRQFQIFKKDAEVFVARQNKRKLIFPIPIFACLRSFTATAAFLWFCYGIPLFKTIVARNDVIVLSSFVILAKRRFFCVLDFYLNFIAFG